ncbi:hypothetical protein ACB098_10G155600 [Castanea mollissima]|uniref:Uncharacterized protein n=1 Tax=Castanea mollissima TaxID=60419 RepID=A0A8J4VDX1_9ROSI|nr:hypothetical protein CMV_028908 [Castanea mollissima]
MGCFACFDGANKKQPRSEGFVGVNNNQQQRKEGFAGGGSNKKQQRKEAERLASEEARAKAAQAAQKRQEQFEKSAAGRAARAQMQGMAKQSANSNKGEPVLKWQMT